MCKTAQPSHEVKLVVSEKVHALVRKLKISMLRKCHKQKDIRRNKQTGTITMLYRDQIKPEAATAAEHVKVHISFSM